MYQHPTSHSMYARCGRSLPHQYWTLHRKHVGPYHMRMYQRRTSHSKPVYRYHTSTGHRIAGA
eukprot:3941018-Rhodomonas_salina.6